MEDIVKTELDIEPKAEFKPKILGFLCNWCSYAGADLAGVSRIQYAPSIRVVRVMCSGRVDPVFVVDALQKGIDGVLITGCHFGDCHYNDGNYEADTKFSALKHLLSFIGFDDRILLGWVSAAEGLQFANLVNEFTEKIYKIGPNPLSGENKDKNLMRKIQVIKNVVSLPRFRTLVGRELKITTQENVYGEKTSEEKFNNVLNDALFDEFSGQEILYLLQQGPKSVDQLATLLNLDSSKVLQYIVKLRSDGDIDLNNIDGLVPMYKAVFRGNL